MMCPFEYVRPSHWTDWTCDECKWGIYKDGIYQCAITIIADEIMAMRESE